jgi:hypothetical protein
VLTTVAPAPAAPLDLVLERETIWVAQNATADLRLTVHALANGSRKSGVSVNFQLQQGSAALSVTSTTTDASGVTSVLIHLAGIRQEVHVSACTGSQDQRCSHLFRVMPIPQSALRLEQVSGNLQIVLGGQAF